MCNADIHGALKEGISRSPLKGVCVPVLNCYSCPSAVAACPLGALQNSVGAGRVPFFVAGFLVLTGSLLGRMVCSFLCPAGLAQELLYKIKTKKIKKTPRVLSVARKAGLLKYAALALLCVALPLFFFARDGIGAPFFCKAVCPAGTIGAALPLAAIDEGVRRALGGAFARKAAIAAALVLQSVFFFRPFCSFLCPLGAVYSLFNRAAAFGPVVDESKCSRCGKCAAACKMQTLRVNDRECIRCGDCAAACPEGAITWRAFARRAPSKP